jgi:hypothetical protein
MKRPARILRQILSMVVLFLSMGGTSYSAESGVLPSLGDLTKALNQYCSEPGTENSADCLKAYLSYRCTVNFTFSDPFYIYSCIDASMDLVEVLDLTQVKVDPSRDAGVNGLKLHQVAFTSRLKKAFSADSAIFANWMQTFQGEFEDSYRNGSAHSLWTVAVRITGTRERALGFMTTVFQDFASKGYFDLVDSTLGRKARSNLMSLNGFYDLLVSNRVEANQNPSYSLYPYIPGAKDLHPLAHHFYTPAYLSMRLKQLGHEDRVAAYVSLLFNTSYEFLKLDRKMQTGRWPLRDPGPFDGKKYALQVQKIYTGYRGALYGIGKATGMDYGTFAKKLVADPSGFISSLH